MDYDGIYEFVGYNGCFCFCYLRVNCRENLVFCSELHDNPGTSITNAAELLATQVTVQFAIHPDALTWIEHYGRCSEKSDSDFILFRKGREEYSLVNFKVEWAKLNFDFGNKGSTSALHYAFRNPEWIHVPEKDAQVFLNRLK